MSKPEDIPQHVWDDAYRRAEEFTFELEDFLETVEIIARAILAAEKRGEEREREACAEVVRKMIPTMPPDGPINKEHEVEYEALGFAMMAIRRRTTS